MIGKKKNNPDKAGKKAENRQDLRVNGRLSRFAKPRDFKKSIRNLLQYIGRYKIALLFVMIFAAASTIFNVIGPKILSRATTELFNGLMQKIQGSGSIDFGKVGRILLLLGAIYAVSALFSFLQGWIMTGVSQKLVYRMRKEISEKINRMPMKYFESRQIGDVLSRITNDVDTLGQSMSQSITTLITSVTTLIGVLVMMISISPLMTLIALIILPISVVLLAFIMKHSQKHFVNQQNYLGEINGQVEEDYSGQNVIKAYNREEETIEAFDATNEKLYESAWKAQLFGGLMQPIIMFVGNLGYVGVAISGSILAAAGTIQVGDIQAFIQYVRNFTQPLQQMAQVGNMLQMMAAAAERVFDFLEAEEEVSASENVVKLEHLNGDIAFEHVKFGYDPEKIIIHDFNSKVKPGQSIAIVGPTGAGKTTMVKLFGMVLQDTWLFKGTIMENIRYGRQDATDEEVIAAAKAAHAHHFIESLPGGYQMELNEESDNVSQGQKQLLTIARAILANSPIMILDEATSSVDTRTEHRIQKAMDELVKGRTSFVIAHRLSTIRNADLILVMKDGDIIEQGNHEELLKKGGFYAELYNSQFEQASA